MDAEISLSLSFYLFIVSIRLGKLIWQTLCQLINNSICCINDLSIQRLGSSELKMGSNAGEGGGRNSVRLTTQEKQ